MSHQGVVCLRGLRGVFNLEQGNTKLRRLIIHVSFACSFLFIYFSASYVFSQGPNDWPPPILQLWEAMVSPLLPVTLFVAAQRSHPYFLKEDLRWLTAKLGIRRRPPT